MEIKQKIGLPLYSTHRFAVVEFIEPTPYEQESPEMRKKRINSYRIRLLKKVFAWVLFVLIWVPISVLSALLLSSLHNNPIYHVMCGIIGFYIILAGFYFCSHITDRWS